MNIDEFRETVMRRPIAGSDGNHSARVVRIAECLADHVNQDRSLGDDDRLLHLMSRVGVFSRSMARDLRTGLLSVEDAATLLECLAMLGEDSFRKWLEDE